MQRKLLAFVLAVAISCLLAALAGCGNAASGPAAASPSTSKSPGNRADRGGVTGKISAENGSTWTVATKDGKQVTVEVTPQTQYGTKQKPADAKQFQVGSTVRVNGKRAGDKVTADRISTPPERTSTSQAPPTTSANAG